VFALAHAGCSTLAVRPPPRSGPPPGEPLDCTTNDAAAGLDIFGAVLFGAAAATLAVVGIYGTATRTNEAAGIALLIGFPVAALIALGYGASAKSGLAATERCRALKQQEERSPRPLRGSACGAVFDRTACGHGMLCVEHRCLPIAPPAPRGP
jgi:hypothetical protein